ncbi:MAG TPA: DUF885 family protein, partial [Pyrinomonadaceae bacterium]|nr:DUF885 family protein [Pyrinomonadaceae bacterium]
MRFKIFMLAVSLFAASVPALPHDGPHAQTASGAQVADAKPSAPPAWVARSNQNAQILLAVFARSSPENASLLGADGFDDQVADLSAAANERSKQATAEAITELKKRHAAESEPSVRQDLEILIKAAEDSIRGTELNDKHVVPYFDLPQLIFRGLRTLLDDRASEERRRLALVRLRRYAGMDEGFRPIAEVATERTRAGLKNPALAMPSKVEVEKNLANSAFFTSGVGQLFEQYKLEGW